MYQSFVAILEAPKSKILAVHKAFVLKHLPSLSFVANDKIIVNIYIGGSLPVQLYYSSEILRHSPFVIHFGLGLLDFGSSMGALCTSNKIRD